MFNLDIFNETRSATTTLCQQISRKVKFVLEVWLNEPFTYLSLPRQFVLSNIDRSQMCNTIPQRRWIPRKLTQHTKRHLKLFSRYFLPKFDEDVCCSSLSNLRHVHRKKIRFKNVFFFSFINLKASKMYLKKLIYCNFVSTHRTLSNIYKDKKIKLLLSTKRKYIKKLKKKKNSQKLNRPRIQTK